MKCINFDRAFERYMAGWMKENSEKYKDDMDVIEDMIPDVYLEFLQKPADFLDGAAPQNYFEQFGFEIENFGGREYRISAVPSNLYGLTEEELFLEMLDNLASNNSKDTLDIFAARLATMACKAAVKGNHAMSQQEAEKLIDELLTLENPYHCPHGRPTIIAMTRTELEKKFKRIV